MEGFKKFMSIFLEVEVPEELCRHLFISFVRFPSNKDSTKFGHQGANRRQQDGGGGSGSSSLGFNSLPSSIHHGLSERLLHGLTERLQSLGPSSTAHQRFIFVQVRPHENRT